MDNKISVVKGLVDAAKAHGEALSADRLRALEYYNGELKDTPADEGRSKVVSRDLRSTIKKILPSIRRTMLNADEVVEYLPMAEGDEAGAEQASDYINFVVLPECAGRQAIEDAIHDALLLRNGVLKWWFDQSKEVSISRHTGLSEVAFAELASDSAVEVLEHSQRAEEIEGQPVTLIDTKIRRTTTRGKVCTAAVPRERFLIHPEAVSIADSPIVGEVTPMRRSDLVAMGYDKDRIWAITTAEEDDEESDERRGDQADKDDKERAMEEVDYYDLYVRVDEDDDGIAELRHMCFAGKITESGLLMNEEVDEVQYCDLVAMRRAHQWEGISVADDVMDVQQIKTVLLRGTLDNLYWTNNPQPVFQDGAVETPDALYNPEFGLPVKVSKGFDTRAAVSFLNVPFVADKSYSMLDYMDNEIAERTGINDASSGLAPEALQNMTATASAMIEQAGIGQTEMIVQNIADGLKAFFGGLRRLVIRHQDAPRMVRLRGKWVQVDPAHWDAEMDCVVNTGLGAGTRERDMAMMQVVLGIQEKLLASLGPDNDFVGPENLYATLSKMVESAGLKTPTLYFTEPDPEAVRAKIEKARNTPSPEQMKLKAEMEIEQAKLKSDLQVEQMRMKANRDKEMAQMEADLKVEDARIKARSQDQSEELAAKAALAEQELSFRREELAAKIMLEREKRDQDRQDAIQKAQAARVSAFTGPQ